MKSATREESGSFSSMRRSRLICYIFGLATGKVRKMQFKSGSVPTTKFGTRNFDDTSVITKKKDFSGFG